MRLLLALVALVAPLLTRPAQAASRASRRLEAWQAHLDGDDPHAVVVLQDLIAARPGPLPWARPQERRAATQDLIAILSLGALAPDPVGAFARLPRRERQDALLDLAAAAFDGGQWGLSASAARAAVEAAPDSLFAPVGLDLLDLVHETQLRWDLAFDVLQERLARFSPGSAWARQDAAHARAAELDLPEVERALRRIAVTLHTKARQECLPAPGSRGAAEPSWECHGRARRLIHPVMAANARTMFACVQRRRLLHPEIAGDLGLRMEIRSTGEVVSVTAKTDTLGDPEATRCVLNVVSGLEFGPIEDTLFIVSFPLSFPDVRGGSP